MSLKSFHILFIACSALLAFWLGVWAFQSYAQTQHALLLAAGAAGVLTGIGLLLYGVRFLRKLRHVSYL